MKRITIQDQCTHAVIELRDDECTVVRADFDVAKIMAGLWEDDEDLAKTISVRVDDADFRVTIETVQPKLMDCNTGEVIRNATSAEDSESREAADLDGGSGVIIVDDRRCYVRD